MLLNMAAKRAPRCLTRSFAVTPPVSVGSQRPWPTRFSSSLSQVKEIRLLFARNKRARSWRTAFLLLAGVGAGTAIGLSLHRSEGFEDWPEDARESLRAGMAIKDIKARSNHLLSAWGIMIKIPRENLTQDLLVKISGLALVLGDLLEAEDSMKAYDVYKTAVHIFPLLKLKPCSSAREAMQIAIQNWRTKLTGKETTDNFAAEFAEMLVKFVDNSLSITGSGDGAEGPNTWGSQELLRAVALTARLAKLAEQNSLDKAEEHTWHFLSTKLVISLWEYETSRRTSSGNLTSTNPNSDLHLPDWAAMDDHLDEPMLLHSRFLRKLGPEWFLPALALATFSQVIMFKTTTDDCPANERCKMAEISNASFDASFRIPQQKDVNAAFVTSQHAIFFCEACIKQGYRNPTCDREYPIALLNHAEVLEHQGETDKALDFFKQARLNAEKVGMQEVYQRVDEAIWRLEKPPEAVQIVQRGQFYRVP